MNNNQYGFTPQTSKVDAVLALKDYVQSSIDEGLYVAVISLDVRGAFDSAWWTGILASLRQLRCRLSGSYFKDMTVFLTTNNSVTLRHIRKGSPQGSASGPGYWNIFYNTLLNLRYRQNTKVIA